MRWWAVALVAGTLHGATYHRIQFEPNAHQAVRSAAIILSRQFGIEAGTETGDLRLTIDARAAAHDGYRITFSNGSATITGARPRSLLFAAGDVAQWKDRTSGTFVREPSFAIRTATYDGSRRVADYVAEMGVNLLISRPNPAVVTLEKTLPEVFALLAPAEQERLRRSRAELMAQNAALAREVQDADVTIYAFLYGNDPTGWSRPIYDAAIKAFPSMKGTPQPNSWEKGYLCPSDPATWKFIRAYVEDFIEGSAADGMYATFWDRYGIYCHDDRCQRNGLDKFPNELLEIVKQYREALHGKPLVVRTWSSGAPHWLGDQWVHAPGYGSYGGTGEELWSRVFKEAPADVLIQTKVYNADCQPDPPFSPLVGKAKPHTEIAEYQESGQTIGRFYFPASSVDYITTTMRKARGLVGAEGGVNVFPGGTARGAGYSPLDDILNSINLYAWRELSWNVNADVPKIWTAWATPIYGAAAAPHMIKALQLSEEAVNRTFSTLGMGSSTNSDFAKDIARRETLLRYTNRYYLPDYAKYLEPTKDNIGRVRQEKMDAIRRMDEMLHELELAKRDLKPEQAAEIQKRFEWMKEFAICARYLDESLWRYRYLRYLGEMLTTDKEQMKELDAAKAAIAEHSKILRKYDPEGRLGSPVPLMTEIYTKSQDLIKLWGGLPN